MAHSGRAGSWHSILCATAVWAALAADAHADGASIACGAAKLSALARLGTSLARCRAEDLAGTGGYPACLDRGRSRTEDAFARADARGGCLPSLGALPAAAEVDFLVASAANALAGGGGSAAHRCSKAKLRAVGRKLSAKLRCHVRALRARTPASPACLAAAESRLDAAFARAETRAGCATTGDAATIEAMVDAMVGQLTDLVVARQCADPGGAPACGGPCPTGEVCTPAAGGATCACAVASCLDGPSPECNGACPDDGVCRPDLENLGACRCIFPTDPCGGTYPVCNGTCAAGTICGTTSGGLFGSCGCVPEGTTPCGDTAGPTCGGTCPAGGTVCGAVDSQVGAFFSYVGCACGGNSPCGPTGIVCPPGDYCIIRVVPGMSLQYCSSSPPF